MCIRDSTTPTAPTPKAPEVISYEEKLAKLKGEKYTPAPAPVSYTHLRAHETVLDLVCRLLLEKKKKQTTKQHFREHIRKHKQKTLMQQ